MIRQCRQGCLPFCRGRSLTARGGYRNDNNTDNDNDNNGFRCGVVSNRSQPASGCPGQDAGRLGQLRVDRTPGLCPERTTDLILMAGKVIEYRFAPAPCGRPEGSKPGAGVLLAWTACCGIVESGVRWYRHMNDLPASLAPIRHCAGQGAATTPGKPQERTQWNLWTG